MDAGNLSDLLKRIDGKSYKTYRQLQGAYSFPRFVLYVDHVQADPFAAPSRMRVRAPQPAAGFDPSLYVTRIRRTALEDYLARVFASAIGRHVKGSRGTGKSGLVAVDSGGQEIIERTAAVAGDEFVEIRFVVGLPAAGRQCRGREAAAILLDELPRIVDDSLYYDSIKGPALTAHVETAEDQEWLRGRLGGMGLTAFVADGAVLPRASGVSDKPLSQGAVISFQGPPELRIRVDLPNRGPVSGTGIPEGVTLIVGGGYHGKSTLLNALERSVYGHIPGDGRELVVTRADAVKIRAEDGRRVEKVNISPFITNLPFGADTDRFSSGNASGSTSQAANIIEAMEAGSRLLLIDEDTSASNFMIRDELMQRLIPKELEPITPFIDRVRGLRSDHGVSTILVMGGSGDYFEVADHVIAMEKYRPRVVTEAARKAAAARLDVRRGEAGPGFGPLLSRTPLASGIDPRRGRREKTGARDLKTIVFGRTTVDLSALEQLVDISQTRAIAESIRYCLRQGYFNGESTIAQILDSLLSDIDEDGLEILSPVAACAREDRGPRKMAETRVSAEPSRDSGGAHPGDYALPRRYEIAAALNRMRSLNIK